jgi:hypothetical protein
MSTFGVIFALAGWWLTHKSAFIDVAFMIIGLGAIYYSRDLAMERVVKFKINYQFARGMYVLVGLAFVLCGTIWLIKGV